MNKNIIKLIKIKTNISLIGCIDIYKRYIKEGDNYSLLKKITYGIPLTKKEKNFINYNIKKYHLENLKQINKSTVLHFIATKYDIKRFIKNKK
jgi:hypothetical protein